MKTICIFSLLEWEEELLHRTHALAEKFADGGIQVLYFERKKLNKKNALEILKITETKISDKITVISVPKVPYWNGRIPFSEQINDWLISYTLNHMDHREEMNKGAFIIESPMWVKGIKQSRFSNAPIFYDVSDDYGAFSKTEREKKLWMNYEEAAVRNAKKIFVTTENLRYLLKERYKPTCEIYTIENGVDLSAFDHRTALKDEDSRNHAATKKVGFIGGIFEWVDLDLIEKILMKYSDLEFQLIGPTNQIKRIQELQKYPHFKYLGVISHQKIAEYYQSLDMGLIPFVREEQYPRLKTVNSNKVFQYLYCGYPVVSTYYQQMEAFRNSQLIYVASDHGEFIDYIGKALGEKETDLKEKRRAFAREHSWNIKAGQILSKMEERDHENDKWKREAVGDYKSH